MRKLTSFILLIVLVAAGACRSGQSAANAHVAPSPSGKAWSVWMADSEMKRSPQGWMIDFRPVPKWDYTQGLFASALQRVYQKTGDKKYFNYVKAFADTMITANGTIKTYKKADYNIDRVNPGKFLINLYQETGQQKYKIALDDLRDQMRTHPRTAEGGFWHKKIYPHQMWLDGLYMATPFLAQYGALYNEPALFDEAVKQIYLIDKNTWHEGKGLFYHGWDEKREQKWADPLTGLSPEVWGRAMGWLAMALVDALDYLPENHPGRGEVLRVTQKMAEAVARYQDPKTGLWWQVVDKGGQPGNYLEGSCSSMFTYFLVKGAKKGYIDQKYMQNARQGYNGILTNLIRKDADGTISITNVCSVAGLGGTPYRDGTYEYYINEEKRDNDPKAVSPFIMASVEFEEMNGNTSVGK